MHRLSKRWRAAGVAGVLAVVFAGVSGTAPVVSGAPPNLTRVSTDILGEPTGTLPGGSFARYSQTEPSFAIDPANPRHMVGAWQEDRFVIGGTRAIVVATSFDGGRRWRQRALTTFAASAGEAWTAVSDPWVAIGPGGRAYVSALLIRGIPGLPGTASGVAVAASADGGVTWQPRRFLVTGGPSAVDDKEAIAVDTSPRSLRRGAAYVTWDRTFVTGSGACDFRAPLVLSRSRSGGRRWSRPRKVRDPGPGNQTIGGIPVTLADGTLVVPFLEFRNRPADCLTLDIRLQVTRSRDGGRTFSEPVTVATLAPGPTTFGPVIPGLRTGEGLPAVVADPARGSVFVTWQDLDAAGVTRILLARSRSGGRRWGSPTQVSDSPAGTPAFTPAVAVRGDGSVGVLYYDLRNDPAHRFLADSWLAVSPNGRGFGASRRITRRSFDLRQAANSRGWFLGDYEGLGADGKSFYPFFVATLSRSARAPGGERQSDVWFARVR